MGTLGMFFFILCAGTTLTGSDLPVSLLEKRLLAGGSGHLLGAEISRTVSSCSCRTHETSDKGETRLCLRGGGNKPSEKEGKVGGGSSKGASQEWLLLSEEKKRKFADIAQEMDEWLRRERGVSLAQAKRKNILECYEKVNQNVSVFPEVGEWMGNRTDLNGDELNERLWLACLLGDDQVAVQAVKDGAKVDAVDCLGWNCVHYCCWANKPSTLQHLITQFNASVSEYTSEGLTPLMVAASMGQTLIVDQLVAVGGAHVRGAEATRGYTALHWAARGGWLGTCKSLVMHGADVLAEDAFGQTPQDWARAREYWDVVSYLNGLQGMREAGVERSKQRRRVGGMAGKDGSNGSEVCAEVSEAGWQEASSQAPHGLMPPSLPPLGAVAQRFDPRIFDPALPNFPRELLGLPGFDSEQGSRDGSRESSKGWMQRAQWMPLSDLSASGGGHQP